MWIHISDMEPPKFTKCPTTAILVEKYWPVTSLLRYVEATDNSHLVKSLSVPANPSAVVSDTEVKVTAEDYDENKATCTLKVKIKGNTYKRAM